MKSAVWISACAGMTFGTAHFLLELVLDELEWLLENRYSYLPTKVDYKVLDTVRIRLGDRINQGNFCLQMKKIYRIIW